MRAKEYLKSYRLAAFRLQDETDTLQVENLQSQMLNVKQTIESLQDTILETVLRKRYIQGMRYKDIAKMMGYSESHVKKLHRIALTKIEQNNLFLQKK